MHTRFILLSTNRSGTNFFRSAISSHPDVFMHSERLFFDYEFHPEWKDNFYTAWHAEVVKDPANIRQRCMDAFAGRFMEERFAEYADTAAVGMDIKYDFWDRVQFIRDYFLAHPPRVIHLIRKNSLRMHISAFLLTCRNNGVDTGTLPIREYEGLTRTGQRTVRIDLCKPFLSALTALEIRKQRLSAVCSEHFETLELTYEGLTTDRPSEDALAPTAQRAICQFLNVDPRHPMTTPHKKISPARLEDIIDNHARIQKTFHDLDLGAFMA